jgi:hypothetical protein
MACCTELKEILEANFDRLVAALSAPGPEPAGQRAEPRF